MAIQRARIILLFLLICSPSWADVLVQYKFTGLSLNTTSNHANVTGSIIADSGSLGTFEADNVGYSTDPVLQIGPPNGATSSSTAVSGNSYFSFTVTPAANTEMDLTNLTFNVARGGSSTPRGWVLRSSIDSYASNIDTKQVGTVRYTFTSTTVDLSGASYQNLTSAVTFRVYTFTPGQFSLLEYDDITLNGTSASLVVNITSDTFDDSAPVLARWFEIERAGTVCTAKIYNDNQFSNLLDTLTLNPCPSTTYRYLSPGMSYNTGVIGSTFSGTILNLNVNVQSGETGTPVVSTPAETSMTFEGQSLEGTGFR